MRALKAMACLVAAVTLAMPLTGLAAQRAPADEARAKQKPVTSFGYLDSNKDERISKEEAKADWAVQQRFNEADADRNGFIDAEEFKRLSRTAPKSA